MGNEIAFRLSGGIFFNLILAARKKLLANQNECLRELLYIFDRSARGLSGNSLGTIASRFRNCDPKLHSDYIKFGDPVIVDEFNGRIQDDYDSVVNEVKHYADQYLDLKVNGRWLARSLMELVEKDDRIREKTEFLVLPGGFPVCKEEFRKMQMVHIYNLLLSVWHYICCTKGMAEDGQETYFALADFAGDSRPRKLDRSRIGFREHEDVKVSYDIEKDQTGRSGLKDRYMQMSVRGNFPSEKTDEYAGLSDRYRTYLSRAYEKHSRKKTFLYEMQRDFYGFFVCNDLKRREALCLGERKNEIRKDYVIRNADVDSFREEHRFIVLSGTGGMGKSMMMTHFMLDTIRKSKDTGEVPVIVMLRDYNPSAGSLLNFIFCELKRHDVKLQMSDLVELLQSGKGVILFDGLDEIRCENSRSFYKEMETLVDSYPAASYIVSSRPTMNFRGLSRFTVYDLQAFSQEQAVEMIEKLDQSVVDPVIKRDFVQDLKDNRFGFRHKERTEFLGNPLFLTIMLLTYEGNHDIPTERYLFYEQAYDAMAKKHDAAKALTREFETGLNSREFQNYFGEFCAITYEQEKYDFTPEEISGYFQEVIEANELETTPEAFIEDVTGKICLIYKDGGKYYFVHRSFQEYFVAYFFSRQLEQRFGAVLDILTVRDEMDHDSMVLPMLYGMEPEKTELCIFIPFLEKVFKGKDEESEYRDFLQYFYPFIYYEQGDVDEFFEQTPDSAIYQYIADRYSGVKRILDGNDLPVLEDFVEKEYVYYDECWYNGNKENVVKLMRRENLPNGYEAAYKECNETEVEIVGRSYAICIEEAYRRKNCAYVVEMLENEDFPLKQEYRDIRKLYLGLKAKYEKRAGKASFRSRFH